MKTWTLFLTLALLIAIPASSAGAADPAAQRDLVAGYVVTNLLDPGVVTCAPAPGQCSLRAAMAAANGDGVDSSITFSVTGKINLVDELPRVTELATVTTIDAGSQWIDIDGNDSVRLFSVGHNAGLTLKNLILEHGRATEFGGIILNQGVLSIIHCSLLNSQANRGGAIYTANESGQSGAATDVSRSYFGFNTGIVYGGAIYHGTGSTSVTNSTFYHNTSPDGAVAANGSGWSLTITNSTIAGNYATALGGGSIRNFSGLLSLRNTIVANPAQGVNCIGTITNAGNNIDSATSCGWASNLGSMSSTNPLLLPLSGSGPSTSMAVSQLGPAVEGVTNTPLNCPTVDQRGVSRPIDGNRDGLARCDIGAVEMPPAWFVFLPLIVR